MFSRQCSPKSKDALRRPARKIALNSICANASTSGFQPTLISFWRSGWCMKSQVPQLSSQSCTKRRTPNGKLLLVEPKLHVGRRDFEKEAAAALEEKLKPLARP